MTTPSYITRVMHYMNDPFIPANKLNPLHWLEALWYCRNNHWVYDTSKDEAPRAQDSVQQ